MRRLNSPLLTAVALSGISVACVKQSVMATGQPAPRAPSVWDRQIQNASDAGDGDYQLRALRQRVAEDAENVKPRLELAAAYRERGYLDVALEICRLAAARFPDSGEARLALARVLYEVKRPQEAIGSLDAFLAGHVDSPAEFYSWLGLLNDQAGRLTDAEASHRKAVELSPGADYLHNNLGYNLLMQKKNDDAAAEFREALRLNPASQFAHNNLGLALANQNAAAQAVASWKSAADEATAHNNMAVVWMEKGNYSDARRELQIALSYNRSHPAALKNLELVSRLDGSAATIDSIVDERSRWERWKAGFVRLWVGPLEQPRAGAKPAPKTGEEQ